MARPWGLVAWDLFVVDSLAGGSVRFRLVAAGRGDTVADPTGVSEARPARPLRRKFRLTGSMRVWLGVLLVMAAVKIVLSTWYPNAFADPSQASFFQWESLIAIWLMGLLGVWLSQRTGFPDALDPDVSMWQRVGLPLGVGVVTGGLFALADLWLHFTSVAASQQGVTQQYTGFVPTLLSFLVAAVIVVVVFQLLVIPLPLWLISTVVKASRAREAVFWVLAVATSCLEPLTQLLPTAQAMSVGVVVFLAVTQFLVNMGQAVLFRRYGYLSAILLRVGFYLVFHVLYIH